MAIIGINLRSSPLIQLNPENKTSYPVSIGLPPMSRLSNNTCRIFSLRHTENNGFLTSDSPSPPKEVKENTEVEEEIEPLWDDGYGSQTVEDYIKAAQSMVKSDGGPPRWFCPIESGPPLKNSPHLLYLPGIDGLGMGMVLHHKTIGKFFQVRCMHIPVDDRTPFEGLVTFVENAVRAEHALFPDKPIYLVGNSFGGCLALSVAALNPTIDLVLLLVNPTTSFNRSQLQPLIPFLEAFPEKFHFLLPYLLAPTSGDPFKMIKVKNNKEMYHSPAKQIEKIVFGFSSLITGISNFVDIFSKQALIWKLKLLKSGAAFSNSRLHAVKCEVLILASGKDLMLPSAHEAQRLSQSLKKSRFRLYKDSGHTLLLEDGINMLTVVKSTFMYRRSKLRDPIADYLPPSRTEFDYYFGQRLELFRVATRPVVLSTLADDAIVRGLKGVPDQGPVLLVGNHMLLGTEISPIMEEFLKQKNVVVHGLAHPQVFTKDFENASEDPSILDCIKVFGAVPVTPKNLLKLLLNKSYVLLYPGGAREALHRKGETYKLFWPEEPEFVRMAARCGAKIVPFGVVGEDDVMELTVDYNDMMRIPHGKEMIKRDNEKIARVRKGREVRGEVAEQEIFTPGYYSKVPGRFYFLFGKPVEMEGREEVMMNKVMVKEIYVQIKSQVERNMEYLMKKREEDPYRHLFSRMWYGVVSAPVPTFDL